MSDLGLDFSSDEKLIRFRIRWVEFFLATVSFYLAVWILFQYLGVLAGNAPSEDVFYYRSNGWILLIRSIAFFSHAFFVQLTLRRAFFPEKVKPQKFWIYLSFFLIITLPWVEQFYATQYIPDLIVIDQYTRRLAVVFISACYGLLPLWKSPWPQFREYQTGGKIAASLTYLIVLGFLMEFIP